MSPKKSAAQKLAPPKKSGRKSGTLAPQPHGGAIRVGSLPGNTPGSGRPKDEIREKLLNIANGKGVDFLAELMDGDVKVRFVGTCPNCKNEYALDEVNRKAILDDVKASVDQRLKGLDVALKYGAGTKDEHVLTTDTVKQLCTEYAAVVDAIVQRLAPKQAQAIRAELDLSLQSLTPGA